MNRHFAPTFLRCAAFVLPGLILVALLTPAQGKSTPPSLVWSLGQYDFGQVAVGSTPSHTFTLTNMGGMSSGEIVVTDFGSSPAFTIISDGCTGKALGGGKSCKVQVEYAPTITTGDAGTLSASSAVGAASLSLYGNGSPFLVLNASFVGTEAIPYDYIWFLNNANLGDSQSFTITNFNGASHFLPIGFATGTSEVLTLQITGGPSGPALSIVDDKCSGIALAPGSSCTFTVQYTNSAGCGPGPILFSATDTVDVLGNSPSSVDYIELVVQANGCHP